MITIRISTAAGRPLAEWVLKCESISAGPENNFSEGEVTCHGPDSVFTIMLPDKLINPTVQIRSRLDHENAATVWVEDNWPAFEELFADIERMTKD